MVFKKTLKLQVWTGDRVALCQYVLTKTKNVGNFDTFYSTFNRLKSATEKSVFDTKLPKFGSRGIAHAA